MRPLPVEGFPLLKAKTRDTLPKDKDVLETFCPGAQKVEMVCPRDIRRILQRTSAL